MSQDRDDAGRFTEVVTAEQVLATFDDFHVPVVTASDIAERTGCSQDSARRRLEELYEAGRVERRETAGRIIYWRSEDEETVRGVNPDDPFWEIQPGASGERDVSERVDEIVYGL
jgi:DNA-binding Lrp family transcriptional regulator